ncbi:hypothetical protein BUALT_Bualt03G0059000 [Buddleja alternifolia]|uniref:Katanin p80 WD40 repeat-containing subunit B1 homolog n=1 Tax=Buddleja alternifolia TaxID=168488 RepID=A0AAV6XRF0_9LAMI|nr:hypothetical protein BUALT_Bualt03G0059000 [Buddleja alternifolia]
MSLCGHTSPVESASFDSAEVLVVAGSSSGAIKLWDLEETKMVRTLTGHRSYCTAVEFHPFGEFFASGSMDTNLKIWDIRKKGCIHTYKGHTRGISTIRFSPDGRWVVSGGFDNVVKVWDLTAGKLLHDFKFHEGHIRSIEFHPLEFLLATGSADKTVKFWDLETFEMIGSARREATGVRSVTFHPDGRTLFCGLDDSLKVYSWEPVICHDSVDMGWSTLGDLCIHDGKLLGGAYYENSVAVWVADISLIEPYGTRLAPEQDSHLEQKCDSQGSLLEKEESHVKSKSNLRSTTPDSDSKEIKTIYVDRVNSITPKTVEPRDAPKVVTPSDSKESSNVEVQKRGPLPGKANGPAGNRSLIMPSIVPRDGPDGKDSVASRRESIGSARSSSGASSKPHHSRRLSNNRFDMERMSASLESVPYDNIKSHSGSKKDHLRSRLIADENAKESSEGKQSDMRTVAETFDRTSIAATESSTGGDQNLSYSKGVNSVRVVNGVAVVHGRTRSLVERFERKEKVDVAEIYTPDGASSVTSESVETPPSQNSKLQTDTRHESTAQKSKQQIDTRDESTAQNSKQQIDTRDESTAQNSKQQSDTREESTALNGKQQTDTREESSAQNSKQRVVTREASTAQDSRQRVVMREASTAQDSRQRVVTREASTAQDSRQRMVMREASTAQDSRQRMVMREASTAQDSRQRMVMREASTAQDSRQRMVMREASTAQDSRQRMVTREASTALDSTQRMVMREASTALDSRQRMVMREVATAQDSKHPTVMRDLSIAQTSKQQTVMRELSTVQNSKQQTDTREESTGDDSNIIEDLMENHDVLLSTFRSRLTKLQVVRHFWERNDVKGAINALRKLPDRAVQADVVGILIERMEIITLDLFSCLLPVLLGLLESKAERHCSVSLELLLKLVAVFGTLVRSTVSAPRAVGVDLHAEERRECCKQCFAHLENVQRTLPELIKRGGAIARYAQQLNLVLQQT